MNAWFTSHTKPAKLERTILLADMNSFFASCHQSADASLRGRAVIVGGTAVEVW